MLSPTLPSAQTIEVAFLTSMKVKDETKRIFDRRCAPDSNVADEVPYAFYPLFSIHARTTRFGNSNGYQTTIEGYAR